MKRIFNPNQPVTLVCTHQELADLWYVTEEHLLAMKAEGLVESRVYARLKELEKVFSGESK